MTPTTPLAAHLSRWLDHPIEPPMVARAGDVVMRDIDWPAFGRQVREARAEAGLSKDALAQTCWVASTAITQVEAGQPVTRRILMKLLDWLGGEPPTKEERDA